MGAIFHPRAYTIFGVLNMGQENVVPPDASISKKKMLNQRFLPLRPARRLKNWNFAPSERAGLIHPLIGNEFTRVARNFLKFKSNVAGKARFWLLFIAEILKFT